MLMMWHWRAFGGSGRDMAAAVADVATVVSCCMQARRLVGVVGSSCSQKRASRYSNWCGSCCVFAPADSIVILGNSGLAGVSAFAS